MKCGIEHVAVKAPVCSKHQNDALVFRCGPLESLFDFGPRIGLFVVNVFVFFTVWLKQTALPAATAIARVSVQIHR
jgi:hypothetical protein